MRRILFKVSLSLTAVAVVALGSLSSAQMTKYEEDQRLGMESHIGKLTGHAADAQDQLPPVLCGLSRGVGRWGGRERAVDRSQAAQLYPGDIQVPLDHHRDFAPGF